MSLERCTACGSALTFVGFDKSNTRVMTCEANLTKKDQGSATATMVACAGSTKFWVRRAEVKGNVRWFEKVEDDEPRNPWTLARCNVHGLEWARLKPRRRTEE